MLEVGVKNYANVSGTLTATPVEGEPEVIGLDPGDTYIFAQEIEKGKKLNTVYSAVEVVYDESHRWDMGVNRKINSRLIDDANILYIVTFDSNGGSEVPEQGVSYGDKVVKPANPTKAGYSFVAWCSDAGLETPFDFNTTIIEDDITLYAKWEEGPTPTTYSITIANTDVSDSCTVTAVPVSGPTETYTVAHGNSQLLALEVEAGSAISTVYSSITATFGGTDVSIDTSTVMNEDKTFEVATPHPQFGIKLRLNNNSPTSSLSYTATPVNMSLPEETGTISAEGEAVLDLEVGLGEAINTVYESITIYFSGGYYTNVDVSQNVPSAGTYDDIELSDFGYPAIANQSATETATVTVTKAGVTTTESVAPGGTYTFDEELSFNETLSSKYDYVAYSYPSMSSPSVITSYNYFLSPFRITDQITLRILNESPLTATVTATLLDTTSETYTIFGYEAGTLAQKIQIGSDINTVYRDIVVTFSSGTVTFDTSMPINEARSGIHQINISNQFRLFAMNNDSTDNAGVRYTPNGAPGPNVVTVEPYHSSFLGEDIYIALGSAFNSRYSDIKYTYDNANYVQVDLTETPANVIYSSGETYYVITMEKPQFGTTIRLVNNGSTSFDYTATSASDPSTQETGTVAPFSNAELGVPIDENDPISDAYSSIRILFNSGLETYANTSETATSSAYLDLSFTDVFFPTISNGSTTNTLEINYLYNGLTRSETINPSDSFTLPAGVRYGQMLGSAYGQIDFRYSSMSNPIGLETVLVTNDSPIQINDFYTLEFENNGSGQCTINATKAGSSTETYTLSTYESYELDDHIPIGSPISTVYPTITYTYSGGTVSYDTNQVLDYYLAYGTKKEYLSDQLALKIYNSDNTDAVMVSYTADGTSGTNTIAPGDSNYLAQGSFYVTLGSQLNSVYSEIKYSYDSGTTWTSVDLTQTASPTYFDNNLFTITVSK